MELEITLSPPNSLILLMDYEFGDVPEDIDGLIAATNSCVAVGTLSEYDGKTRIVLTDSDEHVSGQLAFEGDVLTPSKEISICSVENIKLLSMHSGSEKTHLRVFVNDVDEPDQIIVYAEQKEAEGSDRSVGNTAKGE